MSRLTKCEGDLAVIDELCEHTSYSNIQAVIEKLAHYEDLEEQLEKIYGGKLPLEKVVENLNRIVQNGEEKLDFARILTNEEAEKWDKWKDLAEQGRLIELPCKVGYTVWIVGTKCLSGLHEKQCGNIALCDDCPLDREMIVFDRVFDWHLFCTIQERKCKRDGKLLFVWGETVFATKEEAEAKLSEMRGV